MSEEREILNKIVSLRNMYRRSGVISTKLVGALTVEVVRSKLAEKGFNLSHRNVFIEGVPYEIDLLVLKEKVPNNHIIYNIIYKPEDVKAVLEIKFRGVYGKTALEKIKKTFDSIDRKIKCFYITVSENKNYKYRVTNKNLGYPVFELFTRTTTLERALKKRDMYPTGDWDRLIKALRRL